MQLLAWGANAQGQQGHGDTADRARPTPVLLPSGLRGPIARIAGGGGLTVLIDGAGAAWLAGDAYGALPAASADVLRRVEGRWTDVACGWAHALLLAADGAVAALGANAHGQLGVDGADGTATPRHVPIDARVVQLAAGVRHSLALADDGSVLVWGAARHGRLGLGLGPGASGVVARPTALTWTARDPVRRIAAGERISLLLLRRAGAVVVLGDARDNDAAVCLELAAPPLDAIACGWAFCAGRDAADRALVTWGSDAYGQLGARLGDAAVPNKVPLPGAVRDVACGSQHVLALMDDGRVLAWGWNEHSMVSADIDATVVNTPVAVPLPAPAVLVACGYGYSMVVCDG